MVSARWGLSIAVVVTLGVSSGCREDASDPAAEAETTATQLSTLSGGGSSVASPCAKRIVDDLYADGRLDGEYQDSCFVAALGLFPPTMRGPFGIGITGGIRRARVLHNVGPAWLRAATTEALRLSFGDPIPSRVERIGYPRKLAVVLSFPRAIGCGGCTHLGGTPPPVARVLRISFDRQTHRRTDEFRFCEQRAVCLRR
jgi:hypothetical protein